MPAPLGRDLSQRTRFAGVAQETFRPEALIADSRVDIVFIATRHDHHASLVSRALAAGKHVFVEKPLGFSLAETEEIALAARRSGRFVQVSYHKRFDPAYQRARDEVRRLRGLRFVEVTVLHPDEGPYRRHHALLPVRPPTAMTEEAMDGKAVREANGHEMRPVLDATVGAEAPAAVRLALFVLLTSLIHDIKMENLPGKVLITHQKPLVPETDSQGNRGPSHEECGECRRWQNL